MNRQFPYGFSANGWTAQTDLATHVADMIEQLLLTAPGERVNRPTFGTGTGQLVFAGISDSLAAAQQQIIQASLQQWLSDLIKVQAVTVSSEDSTLNIVVQYIILQTQQQQTQQVSFGVTA
jgi:phage baseplate assembly protein W